MEINAALSEMTVQELTARAIGQNVRVQDWSTTVQGQLHKFDYIWSGGIPDEAGYTSTPPKLESVKMLIGRLTVDAPLDTTVELLGRPYGSPDPED